MFFSELWESCKRRWKVLLAALVASCFVWGVAAAMMHPSYQAGATLVLVPPRSVENPDTNRYLDLGSLTDSVAVVARSMGSEETARSLQDKAPGATYTVTADETTSAPILAVAVSAGDAGSAESMLKAVLARIPQDLSELQRSIGIKSDFQITTMTLSRDAAASLDQSSRYRLLGALAVALLLLTALVVAAVDGLLVGRPAARPTPAAAPPELPPTAARTTTKRSPVRVVPSDPATSPPVRRPPGPPPAGRRDVPSRVAARRPGPHGNATS